MSRIVGSFSKTSFVLVALSSIEQTNNVHVWYLYEINVKWSCVWSPCNLEAPSFCQSVWHLLLDLFSHRYIEQAAVSFIMLWSFISEQSAPLEGVLYTKQPCSWSRLNYVARNLPNVCNKNPAQTVSDLCSSGRWIDVLMFSFVGFLIDSVLVLEMIERRDRYERKQTPDLSWHSTNVRTGIFYDIVRL